MEVTSGQDSTDESHVRPRIRHRWKSRVRQHRWKSRIRQHRCKSRQAKKKTAQMKVTSGQDSTDASHVRPRVRQHRYKSRQAKNKTAQIQVTPGQE